MLTSPFPFALRQVDRRALLREHRPRGVGIAGGRAAVSTMAGEHDAPQSRTGRHHPAETAGYPAAAAAASRAARGEIARGVVAVLPHARDRLAPWLRAAPSGAEASGDAREAADLSSLTFAELGGTSLLAVEAAWRTSRSVAARAHTSEESAERPAPQSPVMTADDFLRGSLEEAAVALRGSILRAKTRVASVKTTPGGRSVTDVVASTKAGRVEPPQRRRAVEGTAVPPLAMFSPASRKRRRVEAGRGDPVALPLPPPPPPPPPFFAIGRAGVGLRHSSACLGEEGCGAATGGRAGWGRVELTVVWSSCLSKCIDATPLVVVPRRTTTGLEAGRTLAKPPGREAGCASCHEAVPDSPECCCPVDSAEGYAAAAGERERAPQDRGPRDPPQQAGAPTGTVYIGSHSGAFEALDLATGERLWSFAAGGRVEAGAACSRGGRLVLFGCHDGLLYAVDRATGDLSWSFETGDAIKCTPVCVPVAAPPPDSSGLAEAGTAAGRKKPPPAGHHSGAVLVGSHDGILRSLRELDGAVRWSFDCGGALFASPAHDAAARVIYAATTRGRVVALDTAALVPTDGEGSAADAPAATARGNPDGSPSRGPTLLWDARLPAPCFSTPAVCRASGEVVLGCVDGGLYCFSPGGEQLYRVSSSAGIEKPVFSSPCLLPPPRGETGGSEKNEPRMRVVWGCHDG